MRLTLTQVVLQRLKLGVNEAQYVIAPATALALLLGCAAFEVGGRFRFHGSNVVPSLPARSCSHMKNTIRVAGARADGEEENKNNPHLHHLQMGRRRGGNPPPPRFVATVTRRGAPVRMSRVRLGCCGGARDTGARRRRRRRG